MVEKAILIVSIHSYTVHTAIFLQLCIYFFYFYFTHYALLKPWDLAEATAQLKIASPAVQFLLKGWMQLHIALNQKKSKQKQTAFSYCSLYFFFP